MHIKSESIVKYLFRRSSHLSFWPTTGAYACDYKHTQTATILFKAITEIAIINYVSTAPLQKRSNSYIHHLEPKKNTISTPTEKASYISYMHIYIYIKITAWGWCKLHQDHWVPHWGAALGGPGSTCSCTGELSTIKETSYILEQVAENK